MLTSFNYLRSHFGMYLAKDIPFDRLNAFIAHRLKEGMSPEAGESTSRSCGGPFVLPSERTKQCVHLSLASK